MNRLNDLYDQITPETSAQELSRKVMNTEIKMTAKKRPSKAVAVIAAAAVSVSALTLTVGAANGWNYADIFGSIFGTKSENIVENIVPEATVLQDTIEDMDFELVAAAADNHGVLAILDIYARNGYKLTEEAEDVKIVNPFHDLFITIDFENDVYGSGIGVHVIEESEEKLRLGVKMSTEASLKDKKLIMTARLQNEKNENGEYEFDTDADYSWSAEFVADYAAEELCYETDAVIHGTNYKGEEMSVQLEGFEVSAISLYVETAETEDFFGIFWNLSEMYVVMENGEKVRINGTSQSGYHADSEVSKQSIIFSFNEPVNPAEVVALEINGTIIDIK